jgi:hypothetical protein
VIAGDFGARRSRVGARPDVICCARRLRWIAASHVSAAFFDIFCSHNSDFGRSNRFALTRRIRFGPSKNPGCGAACSDADVCS